MIAVAIDGPAGAGKSTIARKLAGALNFIYVDTGALYRAVGLFAVRNGIEATDEAALAPKLPEAVVELEYRDGVQAVILNGEDVSEAIRSPEMASAASDVSAHKSVREYLFNAQRDIAGHNNVVMDGRDIGTVVLPWADLKIFLTASPEARAKRRYQEYLAKGQNVSYNTVLTEINKRDYNDSNREIAPLCQADDAVLVDSSEQTAEETLAQVMGLLKERGIA